MFDVVVVDGGDGYDGDEIDLSLAKQKHKVLTISTFFYTKY